MKVRGERECTACGTRWSYYETGSVECPACGSLRSVGVGERAHHTDTGGDLDLEDARQAAADQPVRRAATVAEDACRAYLTSRGFIHGGDVLELDAAYVAAQELKHAAGTLGTRLSVDEDVEHYFLELLGGAEDGDRPGPERVPRSMRSARGLASSASVRAYRLDLQEYVDEQASETPPEAHRFLARLGDHEKRIRALDGDVDPETADALIEAARAVGRYIREGSDELASLADERLDELA